MRKGSAELEYASLAEFLQQLVRKYQSCFTRRIFQLLTVEENLIDALLESKTSRFALNGCRFCSLDFIPMERNRSFFYALCSTWNSLPDGIDKCVLFSEQEWIDASNVLGDFSRISREALPNALSPLLPRITLLAIDRKQTRIIGLPSPKIKQGKLAAASKLIVVQRFRAISPDLRSQNVTVSALVVAEWISFGQF